MHKSRWISAALAAALATIVVVLTALSAFGAPKPELSFTTPPRTTVAGVSSETITVSLPSGLTGPAEVKLSDSSSTGVFRNAADTATITTVTIASGQSQASFRFRDTTAGNPTLSATAMSTAAKKQWNGNLSGSQTETVVPAAIDRMTLAPSTATVTSGAGQAYTATGFDKYGNSLGNVTSQTTFTIAPNGSCEGATCRAALAGAHTVTGTDGAATAQATLTVTAGPLDHLTVTPSSASITAGGSQAYKVEGYDAAGNDLGDYSSKATFSISPDGSCTGATCQAQIAGAHTVTAVSGSVKGTASLSVKAAALDHLQLSPFSATVGSGEGQSYTAAGFDKYGNALGDVTSETTFSIAPNGSCEGATCQAALTGPHTVTGTDGSAEGKAGLQVEAGPLARIAITPQLASIGSGGTQAYTVEGYDAAGNDLGDYTSKASLAITPDGSCEGAVCTASHHGSHTVEATYEGFSNQATLTIESEPATTVSLTFDDGRADQMEAASILSEHKMAATFFIISGRVGASGYMTLPNLEELAAGGNEIADHTVNHLNLTNVNREEAERQVCDGRVQLEAWGFHVTDFAYPQGGTDPELEEIVQNCNLNSARIVSDLVSPGACSGCPYANPIPPEDPYKIKTPDSIKATTSLAELKGLVTQAQQHGGGWVPLVFHHVCDECDAASIDPETFKAFLDWLGEEAGNGVSVKTIQEVIGGEDKPLVAGPVAPPKSEPLPENPSLEEDANGNGVPDCWTIGSSGLNTYEAARTTDAHSGSYAERVSISSFESGDKRLITTQDLGQCAPPAAPTHTYNASAYYKGEGTMRWVAYLRNGQGGWSFWAQGPLLANATEYTATSWKTPQVPSWATAISVGISLRSVGSFTADDFALKDNGEADQVPPSVSITAPENGTTVEGTVPITANATDNVGVESVRFFLDGVSLGSKTEPTAPGGSTYKWNWNTTAASVGTHTLTAVATDGDGNQTTSGSVTVNVVRDTTAPVTSILCNGSSTCSGWLKSPVSVSLKATDNVAVAGTYYTTDGSEPTSVNGTLYSGPFNLTSTTTVKYRSVDSEGNWEAVHSQLIEIDGQAPTSVMTAPANGATVTRTSTVGILDEATDNVGVVSVRFFLDGVSLGSKTTPTVAGGSTYKWNWDTTGVSEGAHTLTAVASDPAGNQTSSATVTVNVVADTTAPTTSILCNGSSTCGGWFKTAVSVTLKATDDAALAGTYYTTNGSEPSAVSGTLYSGAFSVGATTEVKYRSVDASGNWETTHAQLIQVDTQAPATKITSPASGTTVTGTTPILAEATDNVSITSVRFFLDGVSLGSKTSPTVAGGSTYRWNWETTATTKGAHTLTVVATDQAGNQTTSAPISVTVG